MFETGRGPFHLYSLFDHLWFIGEYDNETFRCPLVKLRTVLSVT